MLLAGFLARDITREPPAPLLLQPAVSSGDVVVQVTGAVAAPGLYQLPAGARIQDALEAAGGAVATADLTNLNLARRLRDGEQVLVPGAPPKSLDAAPRPQGKLDLNLATREELDGLPGIGEAYSRRIIDSRAADGPYASIEDLTARRVIPNATFERIRDLVTVGRP